MLEQAPARTCGPEERGAHAGAGLLAGPVTPWGTHAGAACSGRTAPCGKDPYWGSSCRAAAHGKDSRWRSLWRTVSRKRNLHAGAGEECEESSPKEEGAAETTWDELTVTPIPCPPVMLGGRRQRNKSEVEPGKKGGPGEGGLRSGFISHYPTLI